MLLSRNRLRTGISPSIISVTKLQYSTVSNTRFNVDRREQFFTTTTTNVHTNVPILYHSQSINNPLQGSIVYYSQNISSYTTLTKSSSFSNHIPTVRPLPFNLSAFSVPFSTTTAPTVTVEKKDQVLPKGDEPIAGNDTVTIEVDKIADYVMDIKTLVMFLYRDEYPDYYDELEKKLEKEKKEAISSSSSNHEQQQQQQPSTMNSSSSSTSSTSSTATTEETLSSTDNATESIDNDGDYIEKIPPPPMDRLMRCVPSYLTPEELEETRQRMEDYAKELEAIAEKLEIAYDYENLFDTEGNAIHDIYQNIQLNLHKDICFKIAGIVVPPDPLSSELRTQLLSQIDTYMTKPTTLVDYHPGSDNKVRDIVHPSLYPYVHGLSVVEKTTDPVLLSVYNSPPTKDKTLTTYHDRDDYYDRDLLTDRWGRKEIFSRTYQWLPSEFYVDNDGKVTINSYINNLPREETDLYASLTRAFEHVLPSLEQSWAYSRQMTYYNSSGGGRGASFKRGHGSLRNRSLQIITKIVRVKLAPYEEGKKDHELNGAWHAEGMANEDIVATAAISLSKDPHFTSTIYFSRQYTYGEADMVQSIPQDPPDFIDSFLHHLVPLGKYRMQEGDTIVFPNSHIHSIDMINKLQNDEYLPDPNAEKIRNVKAEQLYTQPAERTILVFWLVNPQKKIISTEHIKEQQKYNPEFSLEKAYEHRLKLMEERTEVKQGYNQPYLSLCEH